MWIQIRVETVDDRYTTLLTVNNRLRLKKYTFSVLTHFYSITYVTGYVRLHCVSVFIDYKLKTTPLILDVQATVGQTPVQERDDESTTVTVQSIGVIVS